MIRMFLAAAVSGLMAGAASAQPISVDDIARVPNIQSVSLSADGRTLAAIIAAPGTNNEDTALASWDLDSPDQGAVITPSGNRMKFIAAFALKAERLLVFGRQEFTGALDGCGEGQSVGTTRTFIFRPYLTDVRHARFDQAFAGSSRRLGVSEQVRRCLEIAGSASLVSTLPLDPEHVLIQRVNSLTLAADIYRYNLRTGATELALRTGGNTSPGLFNPRTGAPMTQVQFTSIGGGDYEQRILIATPQTGAFEVHEPLTTRISDRHIVNVTGYDEASGRFYVTTDLFSDLAAIYWYDPQTRRFSDEPILAHPDYSALGVVLGERADNFNQLLGFAYSGPRNEIFWIDPDMRAIQEGLDDAFPGQLVTIMDYSEGLSRVLFSTESGQHAPAYHLLHERSRVQTLGSERPWIGPEQLGEQRFVSYAARDGLTIPAILDLPPGWSEGDAPLPAIIMPHGGPWVRDYTGWDSSGWTQFLTSRGYAVLRPNFRGSTGHGRQLWLAGDAQWGLTMQDDKDDGVAWLVAQGIADPERLAIFGYSYGGFAAAAAVVRDDAPYRCAIAGAPVTNLARLGNTWSENRIQRMRQGQTVRGLDPARHTANARLPVLVFHGDRDVRVPLFHGTDFYNAVRNRVEARMVIIPDMPHQMPWYPSHYRAMMPEIEAFLNGPCGM
ncbi:S9 family peptidase [Alkalicaulis satelles]|uniref:S9 family peptidase n=1 Tax=Alkalicaulis satelles TaxID=2609175 RepID=A0A5M6ZS19_9PROT|nr:prolyl oligopeptidase family serine peptidase [Alkalicaulis satelles]KAA5805091.1 S9 family peptidase [Alkalicaulis satelles]